MAFWFAVASLAATAYTTSKQIDQAKKAQRFRELQYEEEKRKEAIQAVRNARTQLRQQRAEAGRVMNAAAMSGTQSSSGVSGAIAGSMTDLASNMNYAQVMSAANNRIGQYGVGAARANTAGQIWGAYGNLAAQAGSVLGGGGGFGGSKQTNTIFTDYGKVTTGGQGYAWD